MKRKNLLLSLIALLSLITTNNNCLAQRIQQPLGRGVVTVKNGNNVFISWRKLAQEPEDANYNVYVRPIGQSSYTKINNQPLNKTNLSTTTGTVPTGSEIAVAPIVNQVEQAVSEPYLFSGHSLRSVFMDITYSTFLPHADYTTKFIWPADLDGDGEYDFVVDRLSVNGKTHKIEGYTRSGQHLWTVDMGPNVNISAGHNDMVIAYDMDCDGKAEVVIKSSDGTRFWDKANNTWGKYLMDATGGDTDKDNIIDYNTQNSKNPPQYITIINGMTGEEVTSIEMPYPSDGSDTWSRTNKANYMGDDYNSLNGHMGICYLDGIHPSVAMEYMVRDKGGTHHYYISAWGYEFENGKATQLKEHFTWSRNDKRPWPAEFHHIRIGDVDRDGRDDILDGGFGVNGNGQMIFSAGISHGDRFRMSDIDPERPGLETFAIQQNAGDMLGQILYDAATGEAIKKWYLSAVGDVGRGECMDIDPAHKGYEMWSTMGGLYDCTGELIPNGPSPFPREGIWWDGELDREMLDAPDGNGFNAYVRKVMTGARLIEMAKISNWAVGAAYGTRPAFFGDIIGDWRDEVILQKKSGNGSSGLMGFTTDYNTNVSLYCLQENPAYRMQCTTRGYYQSPFPDYYLGYDMPRPQLPPCMKTDLVWKSTDTFTNYERSATEAYNDGKSVLLDLYTDEELTLNTDMTPSIVYAMPVENQVIALNGSGKLSGSMEMWKSQTGKLIINNPVTYTGKTVISEGTLEINGEIVSPIDLRARGTLAGNATVNDITFEGALNYEGGRIAPGATIAAVDNGFENFAIGTIIFKKGLTVNKRTFLEMDIATEAVRDRLKVEGDLTVTAPTIFTIYNEGELEPGQYRLIEYTGTFSGKMEYFSVRNLTGLSYNIVNKDNAIWLIVNEQREATTGVIWTGAENNLWDYQAKNFMLNSTPTEFVAQDGVEFNDEATQTNVTVESLMPIQSATFNNHTKNYTINGDGGFSGNGSLTMNGTGQLTLNTTKSDYTGPTIINSGTVTIKELADAGSPSSIGAASISANNWQIGKATIIVNNSNTSTNRGLTLNDTATIQINSGATALKGIIQGSGTLVKTSAGQLNLNSSNTYTGGTILKRGTLAQGAWNATFGKTGSNLTVENGTITIFNNNSTSAVPNFNYKVTIPKNGALTLNAGQRCQINGSFSGEGNVTLTIPYVRTDISADWSGFTGNLTVTGNQFRLCKSTDMKETSLTLGDGVSMGHYKSGSGTAQSLTSSIGSLATTSTSAWVGNGTYNVGYNNKNTTFAGTLACTINKYGTGNWTLTGAENTASIFVREGALIANNTSGTVANSITVMNGGCLYGKGFLKNVSLKKGGKLMAGQTTYLCGKLTINGTLTSEGGATVLLKISRSSHDRLCLGGTAIFGKDTLEISVNNRTISEGEEFQLFDITKTFKHSFIIKGTPGEGLMWDTTDLSTSGIVRAVATDGIHAIGDKGVKIYPQLVTTQCHIDASHACLGQVEMQLIDTNGRIIANTEFEAHQVQTLEMSHYPAGLYFIRLSNNGETKVTRIMKYNE